MTKADLALWPKNIWCLFRDRCTGRCTINVEPRRSRTQLFGRRSGWSSLAVLSSNLSVELEVGIAQLREENAHLRGLVNFADFLETLPQGEAPRVVSGLAPASLKIFNFLGFFIMKCERDSEFGLVWNARTNRSRRVVNDSLQHSDFHGTFPL